MPQALDHASLCLKSEGLHSVWKIARPNATPAILKIWPAGAWTLVKLLLGIAQPQRQLRGLRRLQHVGVATPDPIGSWRLRRHDSRLTLQLRLEFAAGNSALDLISIESPHEIVSGSLKTAAREVGRTVQIIARHDLFHRDLKPSNVIIDLGNPKQPGVWIIDTVGVRRMRDRVTAIERMLERLAIQPMRLPVPLARAVRIGVLRSALKGLPGSERREILSRLRARAKASRRTA